MAMTEIVQALAVTCELTGTDLSEGASRAMAFDLSQYPEHQVLAALVRCRRECRHRLTLADVITRLEDGRPGPEEAWAMVPRDEASTVVWTDEIREAWGAALPILSDGDNIAARMVFLETYRKCVQRARDNRAEVNWTASLGHDPHGREAALRDAAERGRLPYEQVQKLIPHYEPSQRTGGLVHISGTFK